MALITTNIDYPGKDINLILKQVIEDSMFYKKFGGRIIPAVKSKYTYFDISNNFTLQAFDECPTTGFGDVTLNQRFGQLCDLQLLAKVGHKDLLNTIRELNYRNGIYEEKITDDRDVWNAIMTMMMEEFPAMIDNLMLNGDTTLVGPTPAYLNLCDGLLTKFNADGTVVDVTAVPANLVGTSAILGELQKLINGLDQELRYNSKFTVKFAVSYKIASAYQAYLNTNQANQGYITSEAPLSYAGIELVPLKNLPDNEMFLTFTDNLIFPWDREDDLASINIKDKSLYSLCQEVEMAMAVRYAVDYGYGKYVVYYH